MLIKQKAKVSLLTTVYNRQDYVIYALKSALAQSEINIEIIVWDDGSEDNTINLVNKLAREDKRIKVYSSNHLGRAIALKKAHEQAEGEYFGWLDSDDILAADAVSKTADFLDSHPDIGVVYTNHSYIDFKGLLKGLGRRCLIPYSKQRLLIDFMTYHFRLMRRSVYQEVGGVDERFNRAACDYDLCLKLSEITDFAKIEQVLYFYRIHSNRISVKRRSEQIELAKLAVKSALQRRGVADKLYLDTSNNQWRIRSKH